MVKYETVIGLEIHAQLKTESKMFCSCDNYSVNAKPNINTCPVCTGMPGTLPVANKRAIEWTYLLGMAVSAEIPKQFNFERKNYFYPDLPKAYQITSGSNPPLIGGYLEIEVDGTLRKIRLNHVHLEEDAGKLVHPSNDSYSLVDLNRAGTPLLEIVTEPDLKSPQEARIFMQDFRSILRYLGISDANMEQGNLRCDANISLRKEGEKKLGTKVEIKNMNSFKMIERALVYEVARQTEMLNEGKTIIQETRGWNESKGKTIGQRNKEEANDYRYFPEPDLPPIKPHDGEIDLNEIRNWLPELPKEKFNRFVKEYGLSKEHAETLTSDLEMAVYFEKTIENIPVAAKDDIAKRGVAKLVANWIVGDLLYQMNTKGIPISGMNITPEILAELIDCIQTGEISGKIAKGMIDEMLETGKSAKEIIKEKGLSQITDTKEVEKVIEVVISENPGPVSDYRGGKQQAFGYLVGQVMAKTKGQANPKLVNEILKEKLK
jgi:aspartyl-tRNA(Asn)/glutamyl-tRNA(Gln) amidotransferase subunit B